MFTCSVYIYCMSLEFWSLDQLYTLWTKFSKNFGAWAHFDPYNFGLWTQIFTEHTYSSPRLWSFGPSCLSEFLGHRLSCCPAYIVQCLKGLFAITDQCLYNNWLIHTLGIATFSKSFAIGITLVIFTLVSIDFRWHKAIHHLNGTWIVYVTMADCFSIQVLVL